MNRSTIFAVITAILALSYTACGPEPALPEDNTPKERVIIYSVGDHENRQELKTNAQWDKFLDMVCDYAREGNEVVFYNMCQTTYYEQPQRKSSSFSTSNHDEMIAWMKEKERQGLTVVVSYDKDTGKWNGMAYASSPTKTTAELIIGTWNFDTLTWIETDADGVPHNSEPHVPDEVFGNMLYTFSDNGMLTLTIQTPDGASYSDEAGWTLSDDGELSSPLLPNETNWNVNWISTSSMIITCNDLDSSLGNISYQMKFDRQ